MLFSNKFKLKKIYLFDNDNVNTTKIKIEAMKVYGIKSNCY